MIVVFISSPYTIGDPEQNVLRQIACADKLMDLGFCPILPLLSHYQHLKFPRDYEDWMKIDFEKILRSDCVLRLPGKSKGSDREVAFAREKGIPVFNFIDELKEQYEL